MEDLKIQKPWIEEALLCGTKVIILGNGTRDPGLGTREPGSQDTPSESETQDPQARPETWDPYLRPGARDS